MRYRDRMRRLGTEMLTDPHGQLGELALRDGSIRPHIGRDQPWLRRGDRGIRGEGGRRRWKQRNSETQQKRSRTCHAFSLPRSQSPGATAEAKATFSDLLARVPTGYRSNDDTAIS